MGRGPGGKISGWSRNKNREKTVADVKYSWFKDGYSSIIEAPSIEIRRVTDEYGAGVKYEVRYGGAYGKDSWGFRQLVAKGNNLEELRSETVRWIRKHSLGRTEQPDNLTKTDRKIKPVRRSSRRVWKDSNGQEWVKIDHKWWTLEGVDY
jgi:hypothetical protein